MSDCLATAVACRKSRAVVEIRGSPFNAPSGSAIARNVSHLGSNETKGRVTITVEAVEKLDHAAEFFCLYALIRAKQSSRRNAAGDGPTNSK